MTTAPVQVKFFGAFRKYGDSTLLDLPTDSSVHDLKDLLTQHMARQVPDFQDAALIRDSAVACNDTIVSPHRKIAAGEIVSILPPVCGG